MSVSHYDICNIPWSVFFYGLVDKTTGILVNSTTSGLRAGLYHRLSNATCKPQIGCALAIANCEPMDPTLLPYITKPWKCNFGDEFGDHHRNAVRNDLQNCTSEIISEMNSEIISEFISEMISEMISEIAPLSFRNTLSHAREVGSPVNPLSNLSPR